MKTKLFTLWMGLVMFFLAPGIYGQVIVDGVNQGASYDYDGSDVDSVVVKDGGTFDSKGNTLKFANNGTACYLHVYSGGYLKTDWTIIDMYVKDAHTVVFDSAATVDHFERIIMRDNSVLENNKEGIKFGSIEFSAYNSGGADMTIKGEEPLWINELHLTNRNNMNIQMEQDIRIDEVINLEKGGSKLSLNGNNLKVEGNAEVQAPAGGVGYIDASGMGTISVMANGANAELFVNNKMDTVKLSTNAGADLKTNAYVNLQFFDQAVDNTLTDYLGKYVSISYNDSVTTPDFDISVNNIIANEDLTGDAENLYSALYDTAAGEWNYGEPLVGDSIYWSGDISGYLTARSMPRPRPVDYSPAQQETGVALDDTTIMVVFNSEVDSADFSGIQLKDTNDVVVNIKEKQLNQDTLWLMHEPFAENNQEYVVTVPDSIVLDSLDLGSDTLIRYNKAFCWSFSTVMTKPIAVDTIPADGDVGVAFDADVFVVFDQIVTVEDFTDVSVLNSSGDSVSVNPELSQDTLYINHDSFNLGEEEYTVNIPSGAVKNSDSLHNESISWSFTSTMTTGLKDADAADRSFRCYPVPVRNNLYIEVATDVNRITLMDVLGNVFVDRSISGKQETINMSELKSGVYILKVKAAGETLTRRIIKR